MPLKQYMFFVPNPLLDALFPLCNVKVLPLGYNLAWRIDNKSIDKSSLLEVLLNYDLYDNTRNY